VTLGVRAKLFLVSVALIAASVAAADAYLTPAIANWLTASLRSSLVARARLVAREASASPLPTDGDAGGVARASSSASVAPNVEKWDALADALGAEADARVTLIRSDGVVLGDSEVATADIPRMENHAARPEVQAALAAGNGSGERMSNTFQMPMLYVAVPFTRAGAVAGVARVSQPLGQIDAAKSDIRRMIGWGSLIALGLALVLSNIVAKRMSAAVGELTAAARRMTAGDLDFRTRIEGQDELAELGQALDQLAGSLATSLGELRAERDLQRRILEAMHEGVVVIDHEGRIVLVNPALRSMLLLGADAVGKLLIETVRHADLHNLVDRARGNPEGPSTEIELPGLKPRRVLVQVAPLAGEEDEQGLLLVFVDVTELRRLESLRRDFVANASHELRTPIAAVRSATETLQVGALSDPVAANRFLDIIERNAQRLQSLVEDMLELSKLESNVFKLKRDRVELQRVVPIVLALFRERAEKKGVRLISELDTGLSAVEGDPRALEHVLSNLVDNAVKYCPTGSRIVVRALEDEARVRLVVADNGPGISAEHLPRVFERFYRVDAGRSRELGGTGLGLSIVKHMVDTMRGKVSVESTVGAGSTFTVSLQRAAAAGALPSSGALPYESGKHPIA
jgi:two-component system phosphate regulon sensor histidine kinase PhoR